MRTRVSVLTVALALLAALALLVPGAALAATTAGTTVTNQANVDYKVGGILQTQVSGSVNFTVDALVDFEVLAAGGAWNTPTPGGATNVYYLIFTVTNNSNADIDLDFDSYALADDFDQVIAEIVVESGASAGYQDAEDNATISDELEPGFSNTIYVVASTIGAALNDGDISSHILNATAFYNGGAGLGLGGTCTGVVVSDEDGDNLDNGTCGGGVDWILGDDGDTNSDGIEGDQDAFLISGATLTVTKTSSVIWDPINLATNPYPIPGARIQFTVTVNHTAGAQADQVRIQDTIGAPLVYNSDGIEYVHSGGAAGGLLNGNYGADGNELGIVNGEFVGGVVTVNGISLTVGQNAKIIFNTVLQ